MPHNERGGGVMNYGPYFWVLHKDGTLCYTAFKVSGRKRDVNDYFICQIVLQGGCSMAGWEEELAVLLRELGVTQEESKTHLRPTHISEAGYPQGKPPLQPRDAVKRQVQFTDALFWEQADEGGTEDDDVWMDDLRLMRREVESIVTQVVRLMQRGDLDP